MKPSSSGPLVVKEENLPSSSSGHLRSCFIGMGFSSVLVDKVIEENGINDENLLLQALINYSKANPGAADSSDGFSEFENEESPIRLSSDDGQEAKNFCGSSVCKSDMKSDLLMMDFSEEEINMAFASLGENAPLAELVDFIITTQTSGPFGKERNNGSVDCGKGKNEETTIATLFGTTDKTISLLQMGFTENEASSAIEKYGPDVPISELADSIFASRVAVTTDEEEDLWDDTDDVTLDTKKGSKYPDKATEKFPKRGNSTTDPWIAKTPSSNNPWVTNSSTSNTYQLDDEDIKRSKKAKYIPAEDYTRHASQDEWETTYETKPNQRYDSHKFGKGRIIKEEITGLKIPKPGPNVNGIISRPPFVFYGNLIDVHQGTWKKLSQFLYAIEPEFVNSQFFSAFIRKEGYLHNLPTEQRFHIVPKPPTTIEDALPHTKKWWPSWDTRKQLNGICPENAGVIQLCERLGKMMKDSQGLISKEQQIDIIHQCKRLGLIWVGPHKLRPIEPEQVESILGYPRHHTEIWGLELIDRLQALRHCFQTDTLGYHLSVLKSKYPDGVRILSVFSGIGGAEIALHRLGIHLKCVVSVEASEMNRKILKRWWENTGQTGVLKQVGGIERLSIQTLESLVNQFGGFDIVIGSNPGDSIRGSNRDLADDMDMNHYYEFVRVYQRVRGIMGRNR